jgi:hypothetical protein
LKETILHSQAKQGSGVFFLMIIDQLHFVEVLVDDVQHILPCPEQETVVVLVSHFCPEEFVDCDTVVHVLFSLKGHPALSSTANASTLLKEILDKSLLFVSKFTFTAANAAIINKAIPPKIFFFILKNLFCL